MTTHCVVTRNLGYAEKPEVHFIGTEGECVSYIEGVNTRVSAKNHDEAKADTDRWIAALRDAEWCTWASPEYVVYVDSQTYYYDEYVDVLEEMERYKNGSAYEQYITRRLPDLEVIEIKPFVG